jgi:hypothetical protein
MRSGDKCKGSLDVRFGGYSTGATSLHRKLLPEVTELMEIALQAPDIQAEADQAFAFLDEMPPPIPEIDLEMVHRLWLEKWESGGKKPN